MTARTVRGPGRGPLAARETIEKVFRDHVNSAREVTISVTITGFSILNRARKAPQKALSLIQGLLTLTQDGLHIPAPAVVDSAEAIDAHIAQSEGRSRGKTVVRL